MVAQQDPRAGHPAADLEIDEALIRALLAEQHPDLAALPIRMAAFGWDNAMARLGSDLCVRLPRRGVAAFLALKEHRWLSELAPRLPLAVPAPLRIGAPSATYPWPWSICPWIEGRTADEAAPRDDQAPALAAFLRALHQTAPADAPLNAVRGVRLATREAALAERIDRLAQRGEPLSPAVRAALAEGLAAPADASHVWLHGDLHPLNIIVRDGVLAAVIDWGDLCAGDSATDLAAVWMLFENKVAREAALDAYAPSQALYARGRGWAAFFAIVLRDAGLINNPALARAGAATMARIADGP